MSKSLMESWMDPQAGEKRHEETMISHWFPWFPPPTERRFQILWPQTSAPSTASAGVVQNSTFSSRASYISRSCHNCVVVDLQNQTFNDVENICVHRVHMFILWLHAEMEKSIENPSKLMYTRLHGCVSAERVCVYYIYICLHLIILCILDIFGAFIYTGPGYPACGVKDRLQARTCMPKATALLMVTNKLTGGLNHQKCGLYMQWTSWKPREMRISTN